jgi:hypothetical protein
MGYGSNGLPLSKGPNRVGFSLPSPEDGNQYSFRNIVCSMNTYLELLMMDIVQKHRYSECGTPWSEPFRSNICM